MIVIVHDQQVVIQLLIDNDNVSTYNGEQVTKVVSILVKQYPNQLLVWCYKSVVKNVAWDSMSSLFDLDRKMLSYLPDSNFFYESIGYVEDSIFIKVNKKNSYPTWQMSSYVGGASTSFLSQIDACFWNSKSFDYALNSIAKYYQPEGLFSYSEPKLLLNSEQPVSIEFSKANLKTLFKFIKEHYKTVWIFLLFLNLFINERKIAIGSLLGVLFIKKKTSATKIVFHDFDVSTIDLNSTTIDVTIPTIGREKYLYDVLKDLSEQTHLPKNVIIIEQNPFQGSQSKLDFIFNEKCPFEIKHEFIHQSGACNARNRALFHVLSDWIFFADDDIRYENQLIASTIQKAHELKSKAINLSCLQANEKRTMDSIIQWMSLFLSLNQKLLMDLSFEIAYEFGFGEDTDFGMQMRNKGCDIIYVPNPTILHLKAPIGGFRTKPVLDWHNEPLAPKPSPTILLFFFLHKTKQQLFGYRTTLFFKFYKFQSVKNPFLYFKLFKKQWNVSVKWATILKNRHEL